MFELNGKSYYIDINKVFEIVEQSGRTERKETEITDGYESSDDNGISLVSKVVREIKTPTDTQTDNIRYDFIKTLIMYVLQMETEDGEILDYGFGMEICINTLIKKGILVEMH